MLIVLVVSAVLSVLAVAFVAVNRQQLALTGDSLRRSRAMDAALTGLAYARARLEADGMWGAKAFPSGQQGPSLYGGVANVTVYGDGQDGGGSDGRPDVDRNRVEGVFPAEELAFTIQLVNNLKQVTPLTNPDRSQLQLGEVPPQTIRVRVDGRCGTVTRRLEAILRRKAFTDTSVSTDLDLTYLPGTAKRGWSLATRDVHNTARANGNITVPRATDGLLRFMDLRGSLKAGKDVIVGGLSMADQANAAQRGLEQQQANGLFAPQSGRVKIPQLDADQLDLPQRSINNVTPGRYEFLTATYNVVDTEGVCIAQYYRAIKLPGGKILASQMAPVLTVDPRSTLQPPSAGGGQGWQPIDGVTPEETMFGMVVLGETAPDPEHEIKQVAVDLKTGSLGFPSGATVHIEGDVEFVGANPVSVPGYKATNVPANFTALFGADASVAGGGVRYSILGNSWDDLEEKGGALNVTGNLAIGGEVVGLGGITADGDVSFSANPALSTTKNLGVAVRAGDKMTLAPPPKLSRANILGADGPAFMGAYDQLPPRQRESLDEGTEDEELDAVSDANTGLTAEQAAGALYSELGNLQFAIDQPDFTRAPLNAWAGKELKLSEYVRLREYLKLPAPLGDKWLLNEAPVPAQTRQLIETQFNAYRTFAGMLGVKLSEFFAVGGEVPDMIFRGLVYSGLGGIEVKGSDNSFLCEGAMVSHGNISVKDAPSFISIYNRDFLDDIGSNSSTNQYRLETVYLTIP